MEEEAEEPEGIDDSEGPTQRDDGYTYSHRLWQHAQALHESKMHRWGPSDERGS